MQPLHASPKVYQTQQINKQNLNSVSSTSPSCRSVAVTRLAAAEQLLIRAIVEALQTILALLTVVLVLDAAPCPSRGHEHQRRSSGRCCGRRGEQAKVVRPKHHESQQPPHYVR